MQHHGEALRKLVKEEEFKDFLHNFLESSFVTEKELVGLHFARRLTQEVAKITEEDHQKLAAGGFTDEEILHLTEVTSYFNFVNRMAEGLGVVLEGPDHFEIP